MHIWVKGGELFGFAGLYTERDDPETGQRIPSCAIITTEANALMVPIHNRMPAILRRDDEALWLDPSVKEPEAVRGALRPYDASCMEAWPVGSGVSFVRQEGPELVRPLR